MVRSYWKGTLAVALAWPGLVWGQQLPTSAPTTAAKNNEEIITVKEPGKPEQKCRVLKTWPLPDGCTAREVQDIATGEVMTIVDGGGPASPYPIINTTVMPSSSSAGIAGSRLFHRDDMAPHSSAMPSSGAIVSMPSQGGTCTACQNGGTSSGSVVVMPATSSPGTTYQSVSGTPSRVVTIPTETHVGPMTSTVQVDSAHVPFWKRLFQRDEVAVNPAPAQPATTTVVTTTPAKPTTTAKSTTTKPATLPPAKPATTAATASSTPKPAVDAPQPTDWRRSWGKPEASTATSQAPAKPKTSEDDVKGKTPPRPAWPDYPTVRTPAKPDTTSSKPDTSSVFNFSKPTTPSKPGEAPGTVKAQPKLAAADSVKPDPLTDPERYSRKPLDTKLQEPKAGFEAKNVPEKAKEAAPAKTTGVQVSTDTSVTAKAPVMQAATNKVADKTVVQQAVASAPGVASTQPYIPMGAQSVVQAYGQMPGQVCYLPVPLMTLPQTLPPGATRQVPQEQSAESGKSDEYQANAFSPAMKASDAGRMMPNGFPPSAMMAYNMPTGPMPMGPMYGGPAMQAGYFPNPYAAQAMQAYRVPYPPVYAPPMMPVNYQAPLVPPQANAAPGAGQMLLTLKDALYPSHREWAAEAIASHSEWRSNAQVVDALVLAAKEDPAASVRAGCVRGLAKLNANTAPAVAAIQGLKSDADPRVRVAAEQALTSMGVQSQPSDLPTSNQTVQPASAIVPVMPK